MVDDLTLNRGVRVIYIVQIHYGSCPFTSDMKLDSSQFANLSPYL
jgi:hypothetical protein